MTSRTPDGLAGAETGLDALRGEALAAVRRYAEEAFTQSAFVPGETTVPVGGRVIGAPELEALTDASLDGWLTEGRFAREFSQAFASVAGRSQALLVGSGSQANLLAVAATTSHLHERPLGPGDEVITPALGFSTTVGPLYQYGLVPVYVDVEIDTFNPALESIEAAIGDRTRAILIAHCLGNPFDVEGVARLCEEHDLILIEDCCDALGSTYAGRPVGTSGQAATFSFYPAHHMTTGEGGAVTADDPTWLRALGSLREWGRDCWCPPGVNDACGRRFEGRFGELPAGFDHKYVFSHVGFNFKVTDMQASLGMAQLERLEGFGQARRRNFARLSEALAPHAEHLILPRALPAADPSWFGYPFTLRHGSSDERRELQRFLLERKIDNRLMLGGNLTRQPGFLGREHRVPQPLPNSDRVMDASLWVGCYPGLTDEMVDWIAESVQAFLHRGR
jgi:CDP-6-deoxy-D-xylo-4-hexulose-3-dehydrase